MEEKICNYEVRLSSVLKRVERESSPNTKSDILGFADECLAQGLSKGRTAKYMYCLLTLAEWLGKDFRQTTTKDLKELVRKIEMSSYCPMTKMELKTTVKKLYKWLHGADEYPDIVRWIRPRSSFTKKNRLPEQILTKDEVTKLIQATHHPRDRAFVSMLYETGARIGEILFLRLHSIEFDKHGALVSIPHFGKTGSRRIRIVTSVPYIQDWYNKHPDRKNPSAYLWTGPKMACLRYGAVRSLLTRLAAKVGITRIRRQSDGFLRTYGNKLTQHQGRV